MWGCSSCALYAENCGRVIPTHVGMFRLLSAVDLRVVFPTHVGMFPLDSTVFSTHVGMFLRVLSLVMYIPVFLTLVCMFQIESSPRMWGFFPKSKNFSFLLASRKCLLYKCFQRTDTCRFSFKSFVCSVPSEFQFTGQGMGAMVARHISARYVNLTFHLRRNHHVRRICSRS